MGNTLQKLPPSQAVDPRQVYAALYGNTPIDPAAASAQPTITPGMTYQAAQQPTPAAPSSAQSAGTLANAMNPPAPAAPADPQLADNLYGQAPAAQTSAPEAAPAASGTRPGDFKAALDKSLGTAPAAIAQPALTPTGASAAGTPPAGVLPEATRNPQWDYLNNMYGPGGNAPVAGPPPAPIVPHGAERVARDVALGIQTALNPVAGLMNISRVQGTQRRYQEQTQEYQRQLPAAQEQANQAAYQRAGETAEAFSRAKEAGVEAQGQTVRTNLEQIQFEQGQRLHVAEQIQGLAGAFMQGNLPPGAIQAIGQRIYQSDPIVQARMTPEQWNGQLQAIANGQPTQASMQVAKVGDVPASITWMGQSWNAKNIGQAPLQVQLRWEAENSAHGQQITEEKAKEHREFGNHMAEQMQTNKLELDRMSTMFGFKNAQEAQGRYYKAQQDINDADAQFAEVAKLAQSPNSANDHLLLMKAAGGSLPEGTKRLNVQEIENMKQLGGLDQRAVAELGNWGPGTVFTPETRAQLVNALKTVHDSNVNRANQDINAAHQLFQQAIAGVPGAQKVASSAAPAPITRGQVQVQAPDGSMHTFPNQQAADAFKKAAGVP